MSESDSDSDLDFSNVTLPGLDDINYRNKLLPFVVLVLLVAMSFVGAFLYLVYWDDITALLGG